MAQKFTEDYHFSDVYDCRQFLRDHTLDTTGLSDVTFGRAMMEEEFRLKKGMVHLNHGSFGAVPTRVLRLLHSYNDEREESPDMWVRATVTLYLDRARQEVASFVNADVGNVIIVNNTTTALNSAIKSYPFKAGEAILESTLTYGAIKNVISHFTTRTRPDVQRIQVGIPFPVSSEDEIVSKYEDVLDQHPHIKVAVIDHITSPTSLVLPVSRLAKLCHSRGVLVFVDGAHAIGQLPLDMDELQVDFYVSGLHKWGYAPKGAAAMWFAEEHRKWLQPPIISWNVAESLDLQFFDQGLRDHIPFICAGHALEFYNAIGGMEKVVGYTSKLADDALQVVCATCGLHPADMPKSMEAPNLRLVRLPRFQEYPAVGKNTWVLQKAIFGDSNVFTIVVFIEGEFYVRFSVQIYNCMEDFEQLAAILKSFLEKNKHH